MQSRTDRPRRKMECAKPPREDAKSREVSRSPAKDPRRICAKDPRSPAKRRRNRVILVAGRGLRSPAGTIAHFGGRYFFDTCSQMPRGSHFATKGNQRAVKRKEPEPSEPPVLGMDDEAVWSRRLERAKRTSEGHPCSFASLLHPHHARWRRMWRRRRGRRGRQHGAGVEDAVGVSHDRIE